MGTGKVVWKTIDTLLRRFGSPGALIDTLLLPRSDSDPDEAIPLVRIKKGGRVLMIPPGVTMES